MIIRDLWKFSRRFISYFKAELGGRRRVLLFAVWNETDSDRGDEYNGLNIILLLHLIRHLMDVFSDTFLRIFGNLLAFPPDFHEYVLG